MELSLGNAWHTVPTTSKDELVLAEAWPRIVPPAASLSRSIGALWFALETSVSQEVTKNKKKAGYQILPSTKGSLALVILLLNSAANNTQPS